MDKLVWLDTETTGLNPLEDLILEVACVVNSRPWSVVVRRSLSLVMEKLEKSVEAQKGIPGTINILEQHTKSGLLEEVKHGVWIGGEVERGLVGFLMSEGISEQKKGILTGYNPNFDWAFLACQMPKVVRLLSHRVFDINCLHRFWELCDLKPFPKPKREDMQHRAMPDLLLAMSEYNHYQDQMKGWNA